MMPRNAVWLLFVLSVFMWPPVLPSCLSVHGWPCVHTCSEFVVSLATWQDKRTGIWSSWSLPSVEKSPGFSSLLDLAAQKHYQEKGEEMRKLTSPFWHKAPHLKCYTSQTIQFHLVTWVSFVWHILYILSRKAVWAFSDWIFEHAQQVNANIEFCRLPHEISFQFPNTALSTPPWPTLAQTCQWCQSSRCSDELCSDRSTYAQRSKEIQSQFQYHCHHSC